MVASDRVCQRRGRRSAMVCRRLKQRARVLRTSAKHVRRLLIN
jgi:hypothetical protein